MKSEKQNRREFLQFSAAGFAVFNLMNNAQAEGISAVEENIELSEITIMELQAKMKSGGISAKKLAEKYIERIYQVDPKIHSVVEINPDALKIAAQMDKERKKGKVRSMMHGIPVLIKDNIDTADKMLTTAGSLALIDAPTPKQDAFLVQQLRKSGAVIIGKTNLSEWANIRSTRSTSGWSARGGQTNNPYILDKNPSGSSAGTGAAISASLAAVGVGTETNGSIISPAVRCGLVGIKPTLGLISRSGVIPIAHSQDTAGPMARNVSDATILLGVLVGTDKSDSITSQAVNGKSDYTQFLDKDGLKGAKIGVARQFIGRNPKMDVIIESHLQVLKTAGATLIDVTFLTIPNFSADETDLLLYELKADLNKYLVERNSKYKTLADLIKFNEENKEKELTIFGQELFLQAEKKADLNDPAYLQILEKLKRATQTDGIDAIITKNNLDAVFSPSVSGTYSVAAIAGYPYITVPAGFVDGIPVGAGFLGRAFSEPQLIKFAYAFEQLTKMRQAPKFLPTL